MMILNPKEMADAELAELLENIKSSRDFRKTLASRSHFWFFYIYLTKYVLFEPAKVPYELFNISQDETIKLAAITAFRGSGKSTIMSLSLPIWSILGTQGKRYVVLISQTQQQVTQILSNIKSELESNQLLISDFGPFAEDAASWNQNTITLSGYEDARIAALSTGSNIRGLRERQNRPQLIVCDDIESLESVKTMEGRNATFKWFTQDVLPSGDKNTRTIVIGNLLHEDSLLMRLRERITEDASIGVFKEYPLIDDGDECAWPSKFPNSKSIANLRSSVVDDSAWFREYCLKIISDADRAIYPEWVSYYKIMPPFSSKHYVRSAIGVDLAISGKTYADYTAMVTGHLFRYGKDNFEIYISSRVVNKRLNFVETTETLKNIINVSDPQESLTVYVETVAYQESLAQQLRSEGYHVESVIPKGDKRSRLSSLGPLIQNKRVLFHESNRDLISQLTNFGVEKHDDLADAFVYAVKPLVEYARRSRARAFLTKPMGF